MPTAEINSLGGDIRNGVESMFLSSAKFKKSIISVSFFVPMKEDTAAAYSLLAGLLTRGTKKFDNYTKLNARLNELYGASVSSFSMINGDMQQIVFRASCVDDKYTGENVLSEIAGLLCDMLFTPLMKNGLFFEDNYESEKRLLIENIKADMNDKRRYAIQKLASVMYSDEPAGLSPKGTVETAEALTNELTVKAYNRLLKTAYIRINLLSAEKHDEIFTMFSNKFAALTRDVKKICLTQKHIAKAKAETVFEKMDVTQGKLCMGFSVDCGDSLYDSAVLRVLCDLFGGGPYSKLFSNVREKQSLCYYCAARASAVKSAIIVDSGILDENREKAEKSILNELESLKNGEIDEQLLEISKKSLLDLMTSAIDDSLYELDSWYSARIFFKDSSTATYFDAISRVTLDDVLKMAKTVKLDAIYYLGSKEAAK